MGYKKGYRLSYEKANSIEMKVYFINYDILKNPL